MLVVIHYLVLSIAVECGIEYPQQPPLQIIVKKEGIAPKAITIDWSPEISLRDLTLEVVASVSLSKRSVPKGVKGNGGEPPKPVAG